MCALPTLQALCGWKLCLKPISCALRTCNGKEIKPDGKKIKLLSQPDGSHVLVIEKVGPEHAGEYTVTATNDQGSVSSSAPLEVQGT